MHSPLPELNILSEDFEIPVTIQDFSDLIDQSFAVFEEISKKSPYRKGFKDKLNELIYEYNERRGMNIFCNVK